MRETINGIEVKYCPRCEEHLPVEMFYKSQKQYDGLQSYCKICKRNVQNEWADDNREYVNQRKRKYSEDNREHLNQWKYEYYENNPDQRHKKHFAIRLNQAVYSGKIIKPNECTLCGSTERIQGHHTSYEPGHELDVVWVCAACHASIHIQLRREEESNE